MINCIIGSLIGTLLGLTGTFYIIRWQYMKDYKKDMEKLEEIIEKATTFKISLKDVF